PVLVDLDGDGALGIVVAGLDGNIHAYRHNGQVHPGYPSAVESNGVRAKILSSPALHDINRDGTPDLVLGTNHVGDNAGLVFAIDGRGTLAKHRVFPGFPARIPLIIDDLLPTV